MRARPKRAGFTNSNTIIRMTSRSLYLSEVPRQSADQPSVGSTAARVSAGWSVRTGGIA